MTPDEVIALRHSWRKFPFEKDLPNAVVLASADWLSYVLVMTDQVPERSEIAVPTKEDVRWAWPDGVTVVFDHPVEFEHVILSHRDSRGPSVPNTPHVETQTVAAFAIGPPGRVAVVDDDDRSVHAHPTWAIGTEPSDVVHGFHAFGHVARVPGGLDRVDFAARFRVALTTALGHRLTTVREPTGYRAELRRPQRALPGLRVLRLSSGPRWSAAACCLPSPGRSGGSFGGIGVLSRTDRRAHYVA